MDRYELIATGLIVLMPLAVAALVALLVLWVQDAFAQHPRKATVGVLVTAMALGNLFVRQDLGSATTRPVMALFVEHGAAFRGALGAVAVVLVLVMATSVAVRLPATR